MNKTNNPYNGFFGREKMLIGHHHSSGISVPTPCVKHAQWDFNLERFFTCLNSLSPLIGSKIYALFPRKLENGFVCTHSSEGRMEYTRFKHKL
jgi:hypothetical protein